MSDDRRRTLVALHRAHDELLAGLFAAARAKGYLGADPQAALVSLSAPDPLVDEIGAAAADLWLTFFSCFRGDERSHELAHFQAQTGELNRRLGTVPSGQRPDVALVCDLLRTLDDLWQARHVAVSSRIDTLIAELQSASRRLSGQELGGAAAADELARCLSVVESHAGSLGVSIGAGTSAQRLEALVSHLRLAVERERAQGRATVGAFAHVLSALRAIAEGREPPSLPEEASAVLVAVRQLAARARRAESQYAELEGRSRQLEDRLVEAADALERLRGAGSRDELLDLHRQALAAYRAGQDPTLLLARLSDIERTVTLPEGSVARLRPGLERHLEDLVARLVELHKALPVGEDPRRLRRKAIFGLGPARDVSDLASAMREASNDLCAYAERRRRIEGARVLAGKAATLRAVFSELVALVAALRRKVGGPPPASLSIRLAGDGVLTLPGILAMDLQATVSKKIKAAVLSEIAPLLAEAVVLLRSAAHEALGEELTVVAGPAKRTSATALVLHHAGEMSGLSERLLSALAGVPIVPVPGPGEQALLDRGDAVRAGLAACEAAAAVFADLNGIKVPVSGALPPVQDVLALHQSALAWAAWWRLCAGRRFLGG